jgi:hypothetical protein
VCDAGTIKIGGGPTAARARGLQKPFDLSAYFSPDMRCEVADAKKAKKTINRPDPTSIGIDWPNDELRAASGIDAWGEWLPEDKMKGHVAYGWHFADSDLLVIKMDSGQHVVFPLTALICNWDKPTGSSITFKQAGIYRKFEQFFSRAHADLSSMWAELASGELFVNIATLWERDEFYIVGLGIKTKFTYVISGYVALLVFVFVVLKYANSEMSRYESSLHAADPDEIKTEMVRLYSKHNPSKLKDGSIEGLLKQYKGKEKLLLKALTQKYVVTGKESPTSSPKEATKPKKAKESPPPKK